MVKRMMLGGQLKVPSPAAADTPVAASPVVATPAYLVKFATETIGNIVSTPPTEVALARRKQRFAK